MHSVHKDKDCDQTLGYSLSHDEILLYECLQSSSHGFWADSPAVYHFIRFGVSPIPASVMTYYQNIEKSKHVSDLLCRTKDDIGIMVFENFSFSWC